MQNDGLRRGLVSLLGLTAVVGGVAHPAQADTPTYGPGLLEGRLPWVYKSMAATPADPCDPACIVAGPRAGETFMDYPWDDGNGITIVYSGQIRLPGGTVSFAENIDDWAWLSIDGEVVLDDDVYNIPSSGSITRPVDWYDVEIRFSSAGGGAGPCPSAGWTQDFGFGMDTDGGGTTVQGDYVYPEDNGTMDLFRHEVPEPLSLALLLAAAPMLLRRRKR